MVLALSIILIALSAAGFAAWLKMLLTNMDNKYPTKSLPPANPKKTIEQLIKEALKDPPLGCMWEVKKAVKNYRRAGGILVFDGTAEMVFAEFKFITPKGVRSEFTLALENLVDFELSLSNNVKLAIDSYTKELELESRLKVEGDSGWDGIYN